MAAKPTIYSVADLAGVSVATVSRALKQPGKVTPQTRQRVMAAVQAVGFVPNAQARNLRRQSSEAVILLVRDIGNPFYLDIYKGVEEAALERGYRVLMGDARNDEARMLRYVEMVRERHADGLILMTGGLPRSLLAQPGHLPPMVVALEHFPDLALPTVRIDNVGAACAAVEHLIGLGHRRIAHITGPVPEVLSEDRHTGYLKALAAHGLAAEPGLTVRGDFSLGSGRTAVRALAGRGMAFSAIFASNDEMAVGAINELRAHGVHVPRQVSVVGFDDIVFADAAEPPLTTVHQPRREIGRIAMNLLIGCLAPDRPPPQEIVVPTRLMVRGTTAGVLAPVTLSNVQRPIP